MVKISVINYTYRYGGFDMLVEGLLKQTFTDWELVIVDDLPNRDLSDVLKTKGLPLVWYGKSKEKTYPDTPYNIVNAVNTGLLHANGEYVVFIQDYSYMFSYGLQTWSDEFDRYKDTKLISGVGTENSYDGVFKIGDYSVFEPEFKTPDDTRFRMVNYWKPTEFELFYCGCAMSLFKKMNGIDERADYSCTGMYHTWLKQARLMGVEPVVNPLLHVFIANHRTWDLGCMEKWHILRMGKDVPHQFDVEVRSKNNMELK